MRGRGDLLDRAFFWGLVAKAIGGAAELVGGIALVVLSPEAIRGAVRAVTRSELAEDPGDVVVVALTVSEYRRRRAARDAP